MKPISNTIRLTNDWTEDVNKYDIIEWVEEELKLIPIKEFGEVRIEILIFPRRWGEGKS